MDELDHLNEERGHYLSAFAHILFRVAHADSQVCEKEAQHIENILQNWGGLSEAQSLLVARMAYSHSKIFGGVDNFLVTREFKAISDAQQKEHLLHCLFAVAAADDTITSEESDTIRKISIELGLSHEQFIGIRQKYLDKLGALK